MGIISWIVLGLIAGFIAKQIMPSIARDGFIMTTLLGIAGAFVGGWVGSFFGLGSVGHFSLGSMATAIVGAVILLFIYGKIKK